MNFDSAKIPNELIDAFKRKSAGLYIGAGLSMSVGLPSWGGLLGEMIQLAKKVSYKPSSSFIEDCEKLLEDNNKYLMLAQILKDFLGKDFLKYIADRFARNCPPPSPTHKKLINYPYEFIITTNYDTLIENAYAATLGKQAQVHTFKDSADMADDLWNHRPFILKAHGDANKTQQGIILTEQDYRQIIFTEKGYQSILQSIFSTKTVLFLGTSLSDPELKLLLSYVHSSFHGGGPMHYALMEQEKINEAEAEGWRKNFKIQLIPYSNINGHAELEHFINDFPTVIS